MKGYFRFFLRFLASLFLFLSIPAFSQATLLLYERSTFTGTYAPISGSFGPFGDDDALNVFLPFGFLYDNHLYNQMRICTNGWIELGSAARPLSFSFSLSNEDLFSPFEPNKALAAWWDDLATGSGSIQYTTLGASPNRVFVVEWKNVLSYYTGGSRIINFQVRLYESSNVIEFWYGAASGTSSPFESASFGIEDHIGGSGHFIDGPTGSSSAGTTTLTTTGNWPAVFYRFSPLPIHVIRPNGGEIFYIGYSDTIRWASAGVSNVKIEYSPDAGTNWNVVAASVPAVTGQHAWAVPAMPTTQALVRITDVNDPAKSDVSDGLFTISEPPSIAVFPDSFTFILNEGDSAAAQMILSNSGLGNLFFEILPEYLTLTQPARVPFASPAPYYSREQWQAFYRAGTKYREKGFSKTTAAERTKNIFNESRILPLIVSDPAGDGFPVDITEIRGQAASGELTLQLVFETPLNPFDFGGFLGLDTDQDAATGIPLPFGNPGQDVGCEYYIGLFTLGSGFVDLYDEFNTYLGSMSAMIEPQSFTFSIPLSLLSNDEGFMNLAAVVGDNSGPTDWIPDVGHGTVGAGWLAAEPSTGIVSPGANAGVTVKVNSKFLDGGAFSANLLVLNNDPTNPEVRIPVHLTVIGQPNLIVANFLDFGLTYIGFPDTVQLELYNNGSAILDIYDIMISNPTFTVIGSLPFSIPPNQSYLLPVVFSPLTPGTQNGVMTIVSNDPDSTTTVQLTGLAEYPPVISVSPDSFFFALNMGDSITTPMTLDNSAGLGTLHFRITDRQTGISGQKKPAQTREYQRKPSSSGYRIEDVLRNASHKAPRPPARRTIAEHRQASLAGHNPPLPLLISDPLGDGGTADLVEIRGAVSSQAIHSAFVFAPGNNLDSVVAILALDTDQNPATGIVDPLLNDIGADFLIYYYRDLFGDSIAVLDFLGNLVDFVPFEITGQSIASSVLLAVLDNDDGKMDVVAVSTTADFLLFDTAPDAGHAILFPDAFWLSAMPDSGSVPAGGSVVIEIQVNSTGLSAGQYQADIILESNDPASPEIRLPVILDVITGLPNGETLLPKEFVLYQNYPNPFNPATTIRFGLPKTAKVKLEIFNVVGQKVTTLVDESKPAGYHTITFDSRNLSSGMYFYRIWAGEFRDKKKMLLVK